MQNKARLIEASYAAKERTQQQYDAAEGQIIALQDRASVAEQRLKEAVEERAGTIAKLSTR